jgi:hypothetical protein
MLEVGYLFLALSADDSEIVALDILKKNVVVMEVQGGLSTFVC